MTVEFPAQVPAKVVESLPLFDEQGEEWTVDFDFMIFSFYARHMSYLYTVNG